MSLFLFYLRVLRVLRKPTKSYQWSPLVNEILRWRVDVQRILITWSLISPLQWCLEVLHTICGSVFRTTIPHSRWNINLVSCPSKLIITGHFNMHMDILYNALQNLMDLLSAFDLVQHISFPTLDRLITRPNSFAVKKTYVSGSYSFDQSVITAHVYFQHIPSFACSCVSYRHWKSLAVPIIFKAEDASPLWSFGQVPSLFSK